MGEWSSSSSSTVSTLIGGAASVGDSPCLFLLGSVFVDSPCWFLIGLVFVDSPWLCLVGSSFVTGGFSVTGMPSSMSNGLLDMSIVGSMTLLFPSHLDLMYTLWGTAPASVSSLRLLVVSSESLMRDLHMTLLVSSVSILNVRTCPTSQANPTNLPRISDDLELPT